MPLTQRQKENIAKYLFDISKLSFAGMVVGKFFAAESILSLDVIAGFMFSFSIFVLAVAIDKGGKTNE